MARLLRPVPERVRMRRLPERSLSCTHNRHARHWCRGLCQTRNGLGACGRVAPHAMKSRIQRAIAAQKAAERGRAVDGD